MSRPVAALAAGLVLLVPAAPAWAEADTATVTVLVEEECVSFDEPTDPDDAGVPADEADEPLPDDEPVDEEPVDDERVDDESLLDEPVVDADTSTVGLSAEEFCATAAGGLPQLPLSGPSDVLLTAALGTSLVLVGAGAVAAGRPRGRHELA